MKRIIFFISLFFISYVKAESLESRHVLIDFDKKNVGHPFDVVLDVQNNKIGRFRPHKYYNFDLDDLNISTWKKYDHVELDVYNPNRVSATFFFTIQDSKTTDYWSQLNHVQTLSPGWNRLILNLNQLVGERGSVKHNRSIDLSKIKKVFIVIDPDKQNGITDSDFKIDNIVLIKSPKILKPTGVLAFDFSDVFREAKPFINITDKSKYSHENGFGFSEIQLYRNEDSKYASTVLRSTINVNKASFKVNLPNGDYRFQLIIDQLGYWDIPFYRDRMVFVNERPLYKETRNSAFDFLKDILRFEKIEPNIDSDPYHLYFNDVFKKIESEVAVKNGELVFEFEGDETGIALNSLIIWNKKDDKLTRDFLSQIDLLYQNEFSRHSRKIIHQRIDPSVPLVSIVEANGDFNVTKRLKKISDTINLSALKNEKDFSYLQIFNQNKFSKVKYTISPFKNSSGQIDESIKLKVYKFFNQFISPDYNHETYQVSARIAKKLESNIINLNNEEFSFVALEFFNEQKKSGVFTSEIVFDFEGKIVKFPINLNLSKMELATVDFPVGFMAIDPIPYSYFKGEGFEDLRTKYRFLVLKELAESGFTTFSGLPEVKALVSNKKFTYDFRNLDLTLNEISKYPQFKTIFSYGGQFPGKFLNLDYLPYDMNEKSYHQEISKVIRPYFTGQNKVKIVHTYSDEAHGYNDKVQKDLYLAKIFKEHYPFISIGGFTQSGSGDLLKLNNSFDYSFYPYLSFDDVRKLKSNSKSFGIYNSSQGSLDDPRFSFGAGLFGARKAGLSYYIEWNSVGFNDYPYLDFDGRESDIVIFYPSIKGTIHPTLRFLLSVEGLNIYRKILNLELLLQDKTMTNAQRSKIETFLSKVKRENYFFSDPKFMSLKNRDFYQLKNELNQVLHEMN